MDTTSKRRSDRPDRWMTGCGPSEAGQSGGVKNRSLGYGAQEERHTVHPSVDAHVLLLPLSATLTSYRLSVWLTQRKWDNRRAVIRLIVGGRSAPERRDGDMVACLLGARAFSV